MRSEDRMEGDVLVDTLPVLPGEREVVLSYDLPYEGTTAELARYDLQVAERDGMLHLVGSTYSPENDAIYDGISRRGVRLVNFAPILKYDAFPLPDVLRRLLEIGVYATGVPVEIEFAANLSPAAGEPKDFAFLQLRPMSRLGDLRAPKIAAEVGDRHLCHSTSVLGNGVVDTLRDAIVVDYHRFERGQSREVAREVARFNAALIASDTPYLLIGVGRWGSSEPYLGIPVTWDQIAGASVIVEAGFRDFVVTPSQGSHFFQNLISHGVGYFTVNPEVGQGHIDWDWLAARPALEETDTVRHLRFDAPMVVKMNGRRTEGVILKPGQDVAPD